MRSPIASPSRRRGSKIDVLLPQAESNHHHTVIFDRHGRCPQFVEYFHTLFARSQNALRGRWENFWAAEEPCIVRLLDRAAVIEKLIYAAANPVKDRLVERAHHWPGVSGYCNLLAGRPMKARRPLHFFRNPGPMPQQVTLTLTIPPELGPANAVLEELRAGVQAVEAAVLAERRRTGASIVGRKRVLEQSWMSSPSTVEPRRRLRPRFAGAPHVRVPALEKF
jgi:putative transposase